MVQVLSSGRFVVDDEECGVVQIQLFQERDVWLALSVLNRS